MPNFIWLAELAGTIRLTGRRSRVVTLSIQASVLRQGVMGTPGVAANSFEHECHPFESILEFLAVSITMGGGGGVQRAIEARPAFNTVIVLWIISSLHVAGPIHAGKHALAAFVDLSKTFDNIPTRTFCGGGCRRLVYMER
jgi:hypothetical protein